MFRVVDRREGHEHARQRQLGGLESAVRVPCVDVAGDGGGHADVDLDNGLVLRDGAVCIANRVGEGDLAGIAVGRDVDERPVGVPLDQFSNSRVSPCVDNDRVVARIEIVDQKAPGRIDFQSAEAVEDVVVGVGHRRSVEHNQVEGNGRRIAVAIGGRDRDQARIVGAVGRRERPAPGAVAVVDDCAGGNGQRHRIVARIVVRAAVGRRLALQHLDFRQGDAHFGRRVGDGKFERLRGGRAVAVGGGDRDHLGIVGPVRRGERPAPGAVAVVDDRAGGNGQRHRIVARIVVRAAVGCQLAFVHVHRCLVDRELGGGVFDHQFEGDRGGSAVAVGRGDRDLLRIGGVVGGCERPAPGAVAVVDDRAGGGRERERIVARIMQRAGVRGRLAFDDRHRLMVDG